MNCSQRRREREAGACVVEMYLYERAWELVQSQITKKFQIGDMGVQDTRAAARLTHRCTRPNSALRCRVLPTNMLTYAWHISQILSCMLSISSSWPSWLYEAKVRKGLNKYMKPATASETLLARVWHPRGPRGNSS